MRDQEATLSTSSGNYGERKREREREREKGREEKRPRGK